MLTRFKQWYYRDQIESLLDDYESIVIAIQAITKEWEKIRFDVSIQRVKDYCSSKASYIDKLNHVHCQIKDYCLSKDQVDRYKKLEKRFLTGDITVSQKELYENH